MAARTILLMVAMVILVGRHECLSKQEIRAYIALVQANRVGGVISEPETTTTSDAGEATASVAASLTTEATFAATVQDGRVRGVISEPETTTTSDAGRGVYI